MSIPANKCSNLEPSIDPRSAENITPILITALRTLSKVGYTETACQLAARAYVALRLSHPILARRFDILLHQLTSKATCNK